MEEWRILRTSVGDGGGLRIQTCIVHDQRRANGMNTIDKRTKEREREWMIKERRREYQIDTI